VEKASKAYKKSNPGVRFVIGGGGSSNGVKCAGQGKVMIGMASRELKDKEQKAYPDLVPITLGLDGVTVVVNKKNPVTNITKEQLAGIYTGRIRNWSELGGNYAEIDVVGILLNHGTAEVFMKFAGLEAVEKGEGRKKMLHYRKKGDKDGAYQPAKGADGNQPACAAVMTKKNAIAFSSIGVAESLAAKGARVKLLKLNGAAPSVANVKTGKYPLYRPLLVMTKGAAVGQAKRFIDYLLSKAGQAIVKESGFIPVTDDKTSMARKNGKE
jgi:phosphate transport system substrate-binding protein